MPTSSVNHCTSRKNLPTEASRGQYLAAYAGSFLLVLCGLLAFRFAASTFEDSEFSEYSLARRTLTFLTPALRLGIVVAIPRIIAAQAVQLAPFHLAAGIAISFVTTGIWGILVWCWPSEIATILFGDQGQTPLLYATTPMLCGLLLEGCCSAYCRGKLDIQTGYAISVFAVGAAPLAAFLFARNAPEYFTYSGLMITAISTCIAAVLLRREGFRFETQEVHASARNLLNFGMPRVPGDLAFYGLLALPPILVAQEQNIEAAGEFAYALSVLTILQHLVTPLGAALLPSASCLYAHGHIKVLRQRLMLALSASIALTAMAVVLLQLIAKQVIYWHIGIDSPDLVTTVQGVLFAAIPLNTFLCLRSVADGILQKPVAPVSCLFGLGMLVAMILYVERRVLGMDPVVFGFLIGMTTPCFVTGVVLTRKLRIKAGSRILQEGLTKIPLQKAA